MSDFETYLKEHEDARHKSERKFLLYIVITFTVVLGSLVLFAL